MRLGINRLIFWTRLLRIICLHSTLDLIVWTENEGITLRSQCILPKKACICKLFLKQSNLFLEHFQSPKVIGNVYKADLQTGRTWATFQPLNMSIMWSRINPCQTNVPSLHPLKIPENKKFTDIFRGYRIVTLTWSELRKNKFVPSSVWSTWKNKNQPRNLIKSFFLVLK